MTEFWHVCRYCEREFIESDCDCINLCGSAELVRNSYCVECVPELWGDDEQGVYRTQKQVIDGWWE